MPSESTNGGLHGEVKIITIRTFSSYDRADIARGNLEAHGIECWVNADDCGGMYDSFSIRLVQIIPPPFGCYLLL